MPVWIALVGGLLGILVSVSAAIAVVRANLASATIKVYSEDNDALRGRIDTLEHQRDDLIAEVAKCNGRVESLEKDKELLTNIVTGKSAIEHLEKTIIAQHTDMLEGLDKVVEAMAVIAATGQLKNPRNRD